LVEELSLSRRTDASKLHRMPDEYEYELALLDALDTRKLPPDGHVLGTSS